MDDDVAIVVANSGGSARAARWAGMSGFVLPAITLAVYPIWSFPGTQTPATEVALWATTHHDRLVVTMLLNTAGVALWLVFGAAVGTYLGDRLPARSILPMCFLAGFIGCVILLLSGFTAFDMLLYRHHSAETSMLLYDLTFGLLAMSGMPALLFVWILGTALAMPREAR